MTKREIFKILKQEKLFSQFCVVVANSFWDTSTPKTYKDKYFAVGVTNKEDSKKLENQPLLRHTYIKNTTIK